MVDIKAGDVCMHCGSKRLRIATDGQPGKEARLCVDCGNPFDKDSHDILKNNYLAQMFEENN